MTVFHKCKDVEDTCVELESHCAELNVGEEKIMMVQRQLQQLTSKTVATAVKVQAEKHVSQSESTLKEEIRQLRESTDKHNRKEEEMLRKIRMLEEALSEYKTVGLDGVPKFCAMARKTSGCEVWQQDLQVSSSPAIMKHPHILQDLLVKVASCNAAATAAALAAKKAAAEPAAEPAPAAAEKPEAKVEEAADKPADSKSTQKASTKAETKAEKAFSA
ncbi:unnamed protein product, partial [Prorocentrum cordatum]